MPDVIEDGVLYISLDYGTIIHKCACGCGNEVNTPLSPISWKMIYDGESITLRPSIGNWSFKCKSHYWITNSKIEWSLSWSDEKIKKIRVDEDIERIDFYSKKETTPKNIEVNEEQSSKTTPSKKKWWLWRFLFGD
jgi:hypothetical protein